MIFSVHQVWEKKYHEQNRNLYISFVDQTEAFDTVRQVGLWGTLSRLEYSKTFISIIRSFHDGMITRVLENGLPASDLFPATNGEKQGCVVTPALLNLFFPTML